MSFLFRTSFVDYFDYNAVNHCQLLRFKVCLCKLCIIGKKQGSIQQEIFMTVKRKCTTFTELPLDSFDFKYTIVRLLGEPMTFNLLFQFIKKVLSLLSNKTSKEHCQKWIGCQNNCSSLLLRKFIVTNRFFGTSYTTDDSSNNYAQRLYN